MSAEDAPAVDRAALLAAFLEHGAQFVIVGGVAGQVYGATRVRKDLDRCASWSAENLERVVAALRDLGARMKIGEGSIELLDVALAAKTLANMEIIPWRTRAGDVEVLLGLPSTSRFELARYEQLVVDATIIEVDGLHVAVASLADIIRSKEIADPPEGSRGATATPRDRAPLPTSRIGPRTAGRRLRPLARLPRRALPRATMRQRRRHLQLAGHALSPMRSQATR